MQKISVTHAKDQYSKILDRVQAGETITITRYGKPHARLVPLTSEEIQRLGD